MLQLSPAAIAEIQRLRDRQSSEPSDPQLGVRLQVLPGGCAGLFYHFTFAAHPTAGDRVYQFGHITLTVDEGSLPYLDSLSIDYADDLMGGNFRFTNPQAGKSCDCGISFNPENVSPARTETENSP
ncbi:MAG: iron-sulfur cluster assembly accessory protein [Synechococcales bacterium]|nr:iron-sulfur cluster assembly accessory protein [Synechococcales bacterium]